MAIGLRILIHKFRYPAANSMTDLEVGVVPLSVAIVDFNDSPFFIFESGR